MTLVEFTAAYSAIVSTAVAAWNVYARFSDGPRLKVTCNPNMKTLGTGLDEKTKYIVVNATNIGNRATTIQNVGGYTYKNWWQRFRRRADKAWIVNTALPGNVCPHVLEPGHRFMTFALQGEEIVKASREKLAYMCVAHSMGKRDVLVRLPMIAETKADVRSTPQTA
jgi:hypothetical protein